MKSANSKKMKFDWKKVLDFCKKNVRYISAGVIAVLLVVVLAVTMVNKDGAEGNVGTEQSMEAFKEDKIPEINTLIESYYAAYSAGDIAGIDTCATPVSELEKSYITVMSQYVAGYENVHCYTKPGLEKGEYAVSVVMDMRFEGVETAAPGLDFFYVRTNEAGAYYIDNLYSQFNMQNQEQPLDPVVETFIGDYETQEDFISLCEEIQEKYDTALAADVNLQNMVGTVITQAIQSWASGIAGTIGTTPEGTTPPEETTTPEGTTPPEETTTPDEGTTPEDTPATPATETVYVTQNVNIRKEPSETAQKVGSATMGQSFVRTGVTENGWSEIEYQGSKAYIRNDFISTEPVATEGNTLAEGDIITMHVAANVRKSMSESAEILGTTDYGDTVEVIQVYEQGWTKVKWKGKTGYIKSELLLNN